MAWTRQQISVQWFGDEVSGLPDDAPEAFDVAERIRGLEWVFGREFEFGGMQLPGVGARGGYNEFLRVYWFGKRMQSVIGAPGASSLVGRLLTGDAAVDAELTAIYLVRSHHLRSELEIGPAIVVGDRNRQPDFRIRCEEDDWTYIEVTQLHDSRASERVLRLLDSVSASVISIPRPFILEIVFTREPTEDECGLLVQEAHRACDGVAGERRDVADVAVLFVKEGNANAVVPSILPDDARPRMAISRSVVGPDEINRQIVVRVPFADERAEDILAVEARQLPKRESGVVMVDATRQRTAFSSWPARIPQRFTPTQHTRVAGVILFAFATLPTSEGLAWLPSVALLSNPHAKKPLASWIVESIESTCADARRLTGTSD
jgi:hypothetical protein